MNSSSFGRAGFRRKFGLAKMVCIVFVSCAATAIASPAQTLTTLYNFCSQPGCTDGARPQYGELVQATDGNFYGTTRDGGSNGGGTVFRMTPSGALTTLYSFCSQTNCADGGAPYAGLVQAIDGNFYGTTNLGGANDGGTVFKITPAGTLTTLYNFCSGENCSDGVVLYAGLVQAKDGNFYGTTYLGGAHNGGTVFKITPAGTLTTLYSFCSQTNCTDGSSPRGRLVEAGDENFYGTTSLGGANGGGTVFKLTSSGALTTLYGFKYADGESPYAGLVQATDGNLYGTTGYGGATGWGTVFRITENGTLTTLYSFCSQNNCADGQTPEGGLVQATDGNLYGTTSGREADRGFTVFKVTLSGTVTTLYTFCSQNNCADGKEPYAGLVQGKDESFYGTTWGGGTTGKGTVFSLSVNLESNPLQFVPVAPCRLADTRAESPILGGTRRSFYLPQLAKQSKGCPTLDLSPAAVYSLNVTVVPQGPLGYLTIWPSGKSQPEISTLNSYDGRIKAIAAIVPTGSNGGVDVFVSNTSDVVLDIDGYFAPASQSTLAFYPLPPCRVADTRDKNEPQDLGPPYLSGGVPRDFPVLAATKCNIPNSAQAYSLNFTAVPHGFLDYLTLWPSGQDQPYVSTLNSYGGQVVANAAIVPASSQGKISAYATNDTDVVIDIDGYFAPPGAGGLSLYPVVPCRVIDTRQGNGPFTGTLIPAVDLVNSPCAAPGTAQAYALSATVVPTGVLGYLTLWPDGGIQPLVSTLNAYDGVVTSNLAIVPAGNQGKIDAYAYEGTSPTDLILDISSYFAP
jgi:uncharacterized repeat protein (TIGR03803 family)